MTTEADLEARIHCVLQTVFPTFKKVKVEHQTSFTLKIGHHSIPFDSDYSNKNTVRGISDILLKIDGKNIMLLELKRPNVNISMDDISQGISYARLLDEIAPITLISNGVDNRFYNTYTKSEIKTDIVDLELIEGIIEHSFNLAKNDFEEAVNLLLNKDPEVFSKVVNQITESRFNYLIGDISDFSKAICLDFHIDRTVYATIIKSFARGKNLVGIQGSAFSGKTSLLYQVFTRLKKNGYFFLYIDCNDHNYSIFKQLANTFTKNTRVLVTPEQIKEWLLFSLHSSDENIFHLLLDNFNNNISETIKEEILELIDIFDNGQHRILYTIDEFNYKQISSISHRKHKTIIAQNSFIVGISEFNQDEYDKANKFISNKYGFSIANGGQHAPEYRQPRILRHIISHHENDIKEVGKYYKLIAVPDYDLFKLFAKNQSYVLPVHELAKKLANCVIDEFEIHEKSNIIHSATTGNGSILEETFKRKYFDDYKELIDSSIVVIRELPELGKQLIHPKLPELVSFYCIPLISKMLIDKKEKISLKDTVENFLKILNRVPFSDVVGSAVLKELEEISPQLFSDLVKRLLQTPPRKEKISGGTRLRLFLDDNKTIDFDYDSAKYGEGVFIADYMPYAVLSQLGGYPMSVDYNDEVNNNKSIYNFHLDFLFTIGSKDIVIPRVDFSLKNYDGYEWDGVGGFTSSSEGIMEAIVQSIQKCFILIPDEMLLLSKYAFEKKNFNFLYRYYLAVRDLINIEDRTIADKAKEYIKEFYIFFDSFMTNFLTKDIKSSKKKQLLYNSIKSLDLHKELNRLLLD